jgi:hypothetical protein
MLKMDFIESRTELRGSWFWEFVDWAAICPHVCGGLGEGCGVLRGWEMGLLVLKWRLCRFWATHLTLLLVGCQLGMVKLLLILGAT